MNQSDPSHKLLRETPELGHEARVLTSDHMALKPWLRMLSCTAQIEAEIGHRLRTRFDVSLVRFDYMAQLYRNEDGLKKKDLSQLLMVKDGNFTGLTDELERDALVVRESGPSVSRSRIVKLTDKGRSVFEVMAQEHERRNPEQFSSRRPENTLQVIDAAVQMFGGPGLVSEQPMERLFHDVQALRICEDATEVQMFKIQRELLEDQSA